MEMNTDLFENNFGKVLTKELVSNNFSLKTSCESMSSVKQSVRQTERIFFQEFQLHIYARCEADFNKVLFSLDIRLKDCDVSAELMELITKY